MRSPPLRQTLARWAPWVASFAALTSCAHTLPASFAHPLGGEAAPAFEAPGESSYVSVPSASPHIRATVIDFWASWCQACAHSFPAYNALYRELRDQGVTVVGVSVDERREEAFDGARSLGAAFPVVFDEGRRIAARYRVGQVPTAFVVDREGRVRWVGRDPALAREAVLAVLAE